MSKRGFSWRRYFGIPSGMPRLSRAFGFPATSWHSRRRRRNPMAGGGCLVLIALAGAGAISLVLAVVFLF